MEVRRRDHSGYIWKVKPMGFSVDWLWNKRQRPSSRMTPRFLTWANEKTELLLIRSIKTTVYLRERSDIIVRVVQRNRTNQMCVCMQRDISRRQACMIMESEKYKICRVGQQLGDSKKSPEFKSKGCLLQNFLLMKEVSLSFVDGPLIDLMRPTHILKGNLLYSVYLFKC